MFSKQANDALSKMTTSERAAPLAVSRIEKNVIRFRSEFGNKNTRIDVSVEPGDWSSFEYWEDMVIEDLLHEPNISLGVTRDDEEIELLCTGTATDWNKNWTPS